MDGTGRIPKVAILVSAAFKGERSSIRGMLDYAAKHGPWFCLSVEGRQGEQMLEIAKEGGVDGLIVTGLSRELAREVAAFRKPVVFMEPSPEMLAPGFPIRGVPWVGRDSPEIGRTAARYFLERGYKSFAFVGEPENHYWNAERRRGFEETLAAAGFGCAVRDSYTAREKRSWAVEHRGLVKFLQRLPKPTAVFAPMDGRARLVLEACLSAGIKVPEEIAVLGVDNDTILCESTMPARSSIHTGGYLRGSIAAGMLDDLMHGREPAKKAVALPPVSVVTRGSTGYDAMRDPAVARAITFIREQSAARGVTVAETAGRARCSRRYLERKFRELLGRSVRDEIVLARIERVKTLLETGNATIGEIIGQAGFSGEKHLSTLFRKATGSTMSDWRRRHRRAPEE